MGLLEKFKSKSNSVAERIKNDTEKKGFESPFYYPERDDKKVANVVIRFLPQNDPDKLPYVTTYRHMFKGDDDRWCIIDLCPTTFGEDCPICSRNSMLWKTNVESKQNKARARKRKKEYICNILVVKDSQNPEKEGKVFPFRFGAAVYNKIKSAIKPEFDDDPSINPFDLWEGANFNLRITYDETKRQTSYESSKFMAQSVLFNGDETKLQHVIENLENLDKYCSRDLLMSNEDIEKKCEGAYASDFASVTTGSMLDKNKTLYQEDPNFGIEATPKSNNSKEYNDPFPVTSSDATPDSDDEIVAKFQQMINQG